MKKSMKRIVSIALILCLTLSLIPATLAKNVELDLDAGTYSSGDSVNYEGMKQSYTYAGKPTIVHWDVDKNGSGLSPVVKESSIKGYFYIALTGTAAAPGTYTFTIYAENNAGSSEDTYTMKAVINAAAKTLKAEATVGVPFKQSFNYDLPAGSYTVEGDLTNASHPYNLKEYGFDGGVGYSSMTLEGTPAKAGLATYTVKATNSTTGAITYIYIEINVKAPAQDVQTESASTITVTAGKSFSKQITEIWWGNDSTLAAAYDGSSIAGAAPVIKNSGIREGKTLNYQFLYLDGTISAPGTYKVNLTVSWFYGTQNHKRIFPVTVIVESPAPTEITGVAVYDIDTPAAGNLPDTTASVPSGANYSVTSVQWYVDVPGTGFVTMPASEKFAEGKTYYCSVTLAPKTGYAFKHGTADSYGKAYFAGSATILAATPKDAPIVDIAKGTMVVKSGETTLQKKPDDFVNPFVDVIKGVHWFYDDVMSAVKMGLVNGMDATHYKPDDNLTIAQAIKLAACMNQYYYDKKVTLTNATSGVWYNSYVNYAITKGIITFDQFEGKYNNTATRADYVTIFAKALPESEFAAINSIADNKVPDVKSDAIYAPAVYKLYRAGILTGSGSAATYGYFLPNDPIRRSEVAAILTRMMDASTRKTVVLP